jgi:purine-binding chemotaxis protein CheW
MTTRPTAKQILTFRLGEDLFAADIFAVERVLRFSEPRSLPNVPAWIEGVIDYQSRVVPVIDLRKRFELKDTTVAAGTRLVVFTIDGDLIGGIVDEVLDVIPLKPGTLSAPPAIFRGLSADFLVGITRRQERLVVVMDFSRLFSTNERIVLENVREGESIA